MIVDGSTGMGWPRKCCFQCVNNNIKKLIEQRDGTSVVVGNS